MQQLNMKDIHARLVQLIFGHRAPADGIAAFAVARNLGVQVSWYYKSLHRNEVPCRAIQRFCTSHGFNLQYVLHGEFPIVVKGKDLATLRTSTLDFYVQRLNAVDAAEDAVTLVMDVVDALLQVDKDAFKKAIRPRFRLNASEARLLSCYRQAASADRALISSMATSLAAKVRPE